MANDDTEGSDQVDCDREDNDLQDEYGSEAKESNNEYEDISGRGTENEKEQDATEQEIPINYNGRNYDEGKKIRARHFFLVLFQMIRGRFL